MSKKLQNIWVWREHRKMPKNASDDDWLNSYKQISEFSTIEEFWEIYNHIPRPSEVMFNGKIFPIIEGRNIDGFSIFKKGILPAWEDPKNINGCELRINKGINNLDFLDFIWQNILFGVIGEYLEENDEICGCRVTDKSKIGKGSNKTIFNIHIWLKYSDELVVNSVRLRLIESISLEMKNCNFKIPDFEIHNPHMPVLAGGR